MMKNYGLPKKLLKVGLNQWQYCLVAAGRLAGLIDFPVPPNSNIRKTGVSRTAISTDLGQTINPPVAEGFAMFAQRLLDAGFSDDEVRTMAVTIPTRLVEE